MRSDFTESKGGLVLLFFLSLLLIFNDLWVPGLPSYDDCAKAERAREMLESGDYITPHLAGKENFDHPPFYLWTVALSFTLFGKTDFAARLPGALMALLSVWAVYALGREVSSRKTGWWSGFFLTTSYMFLKLSRRVQTDIPFLLFTSLALMLFLKGLKRLDKNKGKRGETANVLEPHFLLYGITAGIAGLIKSVFFIFPLLSPLVFLLLTKRSRKVYLAGWLYGAAVASIVTGWWYLYELLKYKKEFLSAFFGNFVGGHIQGMSELGKFGFFGYFYEFLRHFWLWLPLTLWACWILFKKKRLKKNPPLQLLTVHILFPLIVLSLFGDKTIRYVMFLFAPLLVITAWAFVNELRLEKLRRFSTAAIAFLMLVSAYIVIRPVDLVNRPNYDYILLSNLIESGKVDIKGSAFYHYEEDYGLNQLPLMFYTGIKMKSVVYNESEVDSLLNGPGRVCLLIKKEEASAILLGQFNKVIELEKRYLLIKD